MITIANYQDKKNEIDWSKVPAKISDPRTEFGRIIS